MERLVLECCEVDLDRGEVLRIADRVALTTRESELLLWLAQRPGVTVSRAELLREVWGFKGRTPNSRAPDFAVMRLRSKIERDPERPRHVLTVHGAGYRFVPLGPGDSRDLRPVARAPGALVEEDTTELVTPVQLEAALPAGTRWAPHRLVGRETERRTAAALLSRPGAPVIVQGPAGIGKTWLLREIDARCAAEDRTVWLDLRHLDRTTLADGQRLLLRLLADVLEALDDEGDGPVPEGDPARALTRAIERVGLGRTQGQLRLVIDHADDAQHISDPSVLYALLRSWCERARPPWERFRLLLGLSSEPALLMVEPHLSPFNLSPPIRLGELDPDEVNALAHSYGRSVEEAELEALLALTGGHPALTRAALFRATSTSEALQDVLRRSTEEGGCFWEHIERRARALQANPGLHAALMAVGAGRREDVDPAAARRLEAAGLLRWRDGTWGLRNGLVKHLVERL